MVNMGVHKAGSHELRVEDDVLVLYLRGPLDLEQMKVLADLVEEVEAKHGHYFSLSDCREAVMVSADARRFVAGWATKHPSAGSAFFGASLIARVAMTLMLRAIAVFMKHPLDTSFFATEAEARAWLAERRKRFSSGHAR